MHELYLQFQVTTNYNIHCKPHWYLLVSILAIFMDYTHWPSTVQWIMIFHVLIDLGWTIDAFVNKIVCYQLDDLILLVGVKLVPACVAWYWYDTTALCKLALVFSNWYYIPIVMVNLWRIVADYHFGSWDIRWYWFTYQREVRCTGAMTRASSS